MTPARRKELEDKILMATLSLEEMQEIIADIRKGRLSAGYASKAAKEKKVRVKKVKQEEMGKDIFEGLQEDMDFRED